jgi:hypothetical protein
LGQVLGQISETNPELMEVIRGNQDAFVQMLNEEVGAGQAAPGMDFGEGGQAHNAGHLTIAVTENDRAALERVSLLFLV